MPVKHAHTYYKCGKDCVSGCQWCDGGLGFCIVCGGFEGTLPFECPGQKMYPWLKAAVWKGVMDFHDGKWHYGHAQKSWIMRHHLRRS